MLHEVRGSGERRNENDGVLDSCVQDHLLPHLFEVGLAQAIHLVQACLVAKPLLAVVARCVSLGVVWLVWCFAPVEEQLPHEVFSLGNVCVVQQLLISEPPEELVLANLFTLIVVQLVPHDLYFLQVLLHSEIGRLVQCLLPLGIKYHV